MSGSIDRVRERLPPMVEGEFLLTKEDFARLSGMLLADAGITMAASKATLLYSRLAKRLRALGLTEFRQYCDLLTDPQQTEERGHMLAALTTNVTRFFREPHHFDHLRTQVLPPLLAAAQKGQRVRIWSAACSSGQEPYSIALTILGCCQMPGGMTCGCWRRISTRTWWPPAGPGATATTCCRRCRSRCGSAGSSPAPTGWRWARRCAGWWGSAS